MAREEILNLNIEGLRVKLDELAGNEGILQDHLLTHFGLKSTKNNNSDYDECSFEIADNVAISPYSAFTLTDVQDSVLTFTGNRLPEIRQWIAEFEDCSCAVR